jgi:hypothetical protein
MKRALPAMFIKVDTLAWLVLVPYGHPLISMSLSATVEKKFCRR